MGSEFDRHFSSVGRASYAESESCWFNSSKCHFSKLTKSQVHHHLRISCGSSIGWYTSRHLGQPWLHFELTSISWSRALRWLKPLRGKPLNYNSSCNNHAHHLAYCIILHPATSDWPGAIPCPYDSAGSPTCNFFTFQLNCHTLRPHTKWRPTIYGIPFTCLDSFRLLVRDAMWVIYFISLNITLITDFIQHITLLSQQLKYPPHLLP